MKRNVRINFKPARQKSLLFLGMIVLLIGIIGCRNKIEQKELQQSLPNIVLFMVDDMGWQDTSVPFWNSVTELNKKYHTPNMENLVAQGIKFTQAYATPVCSPTRVSLMTGMNAARHRVTNWTLKKNASNDKKDSILEFPLWNVNGLSAVEGIERTVYAKPLPQLLKEHGYKTIHVGKAHFGAIGTPGSNPTNIGFDVNIAGHAAGAPESYLGTENFGNGKAGKEEWAVPGLEKYHGKDIFLSEALTLEALDALDQTKEKPFFLYMSHYAVHTPLYGDKRFLQKYLNAGLDSIEAKYASMIEGMDKSLGDIMKYLDKNKLSDNTIILFMSDNGGLSAHARGGEPNTHNKPLASGKGSMYEGGIREPMIVKYPMGNNKNVSTDEPVIIEDFFATILEMAGIQNPKIPQTLDGRSFMEVIKNPNTTHSSSERAFFWHYPNLWGGTGPGIGTSSMIRKGDYKLIYFHKDRSKELYNITKDIGEHKNLVTENPEIVAKLSKELGGYLRSVNAQMPIDKRTGEVVEWPDEKYSAN